jgi:hypothetical protein
MVFANEFLYIHGSPTHLLSVHVPDQGLLVSDIFVVHVASLRQTFYFARQNLAGFFHSFSPMSPGRTFTIWSGRWESNPHPFPAKALKSLVETKQSVAPH